MPNRSKKSRKFKFNGKLLDELLVNYQGTPDYMFGSEGLLEPELTHYLGYEKHVKFDGGGNARNGTTEKTVKTKTDQFNIAVPRDRGRLF